MRVGTWNYNSLLSVDSAKRRKRLGFLRGLIQSLDLVCLQEVHGGEARMQLELHVCHNEFDIYYDANANAGGIVVMVRKSQRACSCRR